MLGAIGVVYGDIGTSPLYAMRESLAHYSGHGGAIDPSVVYGIISLFIWALTLVVTIKRFDTTVVATARVPVLDVGGKRSGTAPFAIDLTADAVGTHTLEVAAEDAEPELVAVAPSREVVIGLTMRIAPPGSWLVVHQPTCPPGPCCTCTPHAIRSQGGQA